MGYFIDELGKECRYSSPTRIYQSEGEGLARIQRRPLFGAGRPEMTINKVESQIEKKPTEEKNGFLLRSLAKDGSKRLEEITAPEKKLEAIFEE